MAGGEALSDEYITELLKQDAKAVSSRSSSVGYGGLAPRRQAGAAAPKPNTRFLRNILRDTDNHNAALLAKEAEESRARLQRLKNERLRKYKPEQALYSARSRHEAGGEPAAKRRRTEDRQREEREKDRHQEHEPVHRSRRGQADDQEKRAPSRRDKTHREAARTSDDDDEAHGRNRESMHEDHHSVRRSRSPQRLRSRSRSRSRGHRVVHQRHARRRQSRSLDRYREAPTETRTQESRRRRSSADSDPLDAIIGPQPPMAEAAVRSRGRGTLTDKSAMDQHFASSYDPSTDVRLETEDGDDWDQALEALRDRQKWKQQGAERLKAAGFTDAEVQKWEKGGEKAEDDVRWSKKGEGREWDRGKVVDEDGLVDVKAQWGRLKGT